ncbi:MAG TPA: hypoxanthine phosphoribosyltransferase [Phycisphaerae bacterium]|nr:hypoxanthine phosphoribosyltransferase [Phycisphaerae bacterium]
MIDSPQTGRGFGEDISRILVSAGEIEARVLDIARQLTDEYGQRELTIVPVLTGSLIFLADLVRQLPIKMRIDVMSVTSYPGKSTRSQGPVISFVPSVDFSGRDVLILDDILDSGQTLKAIIDYVAGQSPASIRSCVLLEKARPDVPDRLRADYVGFSLPDEFVVGYGLDYNHLYRNLPDICVLDDSVYKEQ